ncbi:MAG: hypothetical protein KGO93_05620 [Cyanobacteria bacterium REEB446]|nr:hypothetical protein [Cyanobacteria bacterium REEB446]
MLNTTSEQAKPREPVGLVSQQAVKHVNQTVNKNTLSAKQAQLAENSVHDTKTLSSRVNIHETEEFKDFLHSFKELLNGSSPQENINLEILKTFLQASAGIIKGSHLEESHQDLHNFTDTAIKNSLAEINLDIPHQKSELSVKDTFKELIEGIYTQAPQLIKKIQEDVDPALPKYTNKTFENIFNFIKPLTDLITKNQMLLAKFGSVAHGLDAFVRVTNIGKAFEGQIGSLSMWWSKIMNPLGNILMGFESLAKNDLVDALTRFSMIAKFTVKEAPNLGIPLGIFLSHKMAVLTAQNTGIIPNLQKSFSSMGESVSYYTNLYKKFLGTLASELKENVSIPKKLENLATLYSYPVLAISSLIGSLTIKDQLNTPYARLIGLLRNSSGGLCDVTFTAQRMRKLEQRAQENQEEKPKLGEMMKDYQISFMLKYLMNSLLDLSMRFWNQEKSVIIQSQISNSIYEMANAESGADHDEPAPKIKKLAPDAANNIVNFTSKLKPLLELSNSRNEEKILAKAKAA